ncbi:hypothetical protein CPB84DRAFT_1851062 [Gymnopilus junonius]|uniref:Uncharacterized protein n=1 Tax=Gymnopilus junonius TaxID=109634 RepID=A0A9P5TJA6_GYMJU|nr:hypothetical protein CPB84DRAFT_1851062 [Gymnopilus junonius]
MDAGDLTKILMLTPALTDLECNDIPFSDICTLSVEAEGSALVPLLRSLVIHSPSMIQEVESLAQSRSRIADSQARRPYMNTRNSPWRSDFSVRLVFQSGDLCNGIAERLSSHESDYPFKIKLTHVLWELDLAIAECKAQFPRKNSFAFIDSISERKAAKKLDNGVSFLEEIPLENLPEFQVWVLTVLYYFRALDTDSIPFQRKFDFLNRVNDLFAFCVLLIKQQSFNRRFIRHGRYCLLYVTHPQGNFSPEEVFLHDRYAMVSDEEVFWPYQDYHESGKDYLKWRRDVGRP